MKSKIENASSISNSPLVSIGLPTYNRPDFLRRAIEDLSQQTYPNWELIVSDDCYPTDENKKVVDDFIARGLNIKYYRPDHNLGGVGNHKKVLDLSTGEFFLWASDDDTWNHKFIETGLAALNTKPEANCWMCSFVNTDSFGRITRTYPGMSRFTSTTNKTIDLIKYALESECLGKALIFHGLFRTKVLKDYSDRYFLSDPPWTDNPYIFGFLSENNIIASDDVLLYKAVLSDSDDANKNVIAKKTMGTLWGIYSFEDSFSTTKEYFKSSRTTGYGLLGAICILIRIPLAFRNKYLPFIKKYCSFKKN